MPTFTFKNTKTNEVFEEFMSGEKKEQYLKDNPHIVQEIFHGMAAQGDPFRLGVRKPDDNFKDVLKHIKRTHRSTITNLGSKHI